MRVYFEDLKQDVQRELVGELLVRLAEEDRNYREKARDIGMAPDEYLEEMAEHVINTRNSGVDMEF